MVATRIAGPVGEFEIVSLPHGRPVLGLGHWCEERRFFHFFHSVKNPNVQCPSCLVTGSLLAIAQAEKKRRGK